MGGRKFGRVNTVPSAEPPRDEPLLINLIVFFFLQKKKEKALFGFAKEFGLQNFREVESVNRRV
jgi:hypothetical protein